MKDDLATTLQRRVNALEPALKDCVEELERLRYILLPGYRGKIGEPDLGCIKRARKLVPKLRTPR